MKYVTITIPESKFFLLYTTLIFKPLKKLTDNEIQVFSDFLEQNWSKRGIGRVDRNKLIFSTQSKKELRERLQIPRASFYNVMGSLRDKGLLTYEELNQDYLVYPDKDYKIGFHIKMV